MCKDRINCWSLPIASILLLTPVVVQAEETLDSSSAVITVTGTREETLQAETAETVGVIDEQEVDDVSQTNGEGHVTVIRQPISTKAVYLYLEDGIPTRLTGFFNHNAMYEVNMPQASSIEVTKVPRTALYGSDAIGGVVNVLTRPAPLDADALSSWIKVMNNRTAGL